MSGLTLITSATRKTNKTRDFQKNDPVGQCKLCRFKELQEKVVYLKYQWLGKKERRERRRGGKRWEIQSKIKSRSELRL